MGSPKGICRSLGFWPRDSIDPYLECFTTIFLQCGVSLLFIVVSLAVITFSSICKMWRGEIRRYLPSFRNRTNIYDNNLESQPFFSQDVSYGSSEPIKNNSKAFTNSKPSNSSLKYIVEPHKHNSKLVFWTIFYLFTLIVFTVYQSHLPSTSSTYFPWAPIITLTSWLYITILVLLNGTFKYLYHLRLFYLLAFGIECFKLRTLVLIETRNEHFTMELGFIFFSLVIQVVLTLYSFFMSPLLEKFNQHIAGRSSIYPCPEAYESYLSLATFSWVIPLLSYGYYNPIEPADVWDIRPEEKSQPLCEGFLHFPLAWSFATKIFVYFRKELFFQFLFSIFTIFFGFAIPFLLHAFLVLIENPNQPILIGSSPTEYGIYLVIMLFIAGTLKSFADSQTLFFGRRIGIQVKAIVMGEVYSKTLRRKDQSSLKDDNSTSNSGKITNFLSVDAHEIAETCCYIHFLYTVPIEIAVTSWYLYVILGWSSLAGLGVTFLVMPINYMVSLYWEKVQEELMACSDKRMDIVTELLQAIRIIKFFAWEQQFQDRINEARKEELRVLAKRMYVWIIGAAVWFCFPMFITIVTFFSYTKWAGNVLTPTVAFTSMMIFKTLKEPVDLLPEIINMLLQAKVSLGRIDKFLKEKETKKNLILKTQSSPNDPIIGFKNVTLQWDPIDSVSQFSMENINISFPINELSLIIGPTGSGKTSLLLGLLGEMNVVSGSIYLPRKGIGFTHNYSADFELNGGVAYVAQNAWIQQDTIRNNILFGEEFHEERYKETIRACALLPDFKELQDGDLTEVGEKGLTLSGGQKQRVALARAVYSRASHIVMDDCLSAVDAHTAKFLFKNCIEGKLLRNRTRILVTHNVSLTFNKAALITVLNKQGQIVVQGSPKQLKNHPSVQKELIEESENNQEILIESSDIDSRFDNLDYTLSKPQNENSAKKLVLEEERAKGAVSFAVYGSYFNAAGGSFYWVGLLVCFLLYQLIPIILDWWIKIWASEGTQMPGDFFLTIDKFTPLNLSYDLNTFLNFHPSVQYFIRADQTNYYINVYMLITLVSILSIILRISYQFWGSMNASKKLHTSLLNNILRAPVRFFDSTPIGRLTNRFSKDLQCIDQELMANTGAFLAEILFSIGILIVLIIILPQFLLIACIILIIYYFIVQYYIRGSRELKRIESTSRSPIYTHCGETILGVTTIRAYEQDVRFIHNSYSKIDDNLRCFFYLWVANRWLQIRSDFTGNLVALTTGLLLLLLKDSLSPSIIGLALSYSLNFSSHILWIARFYSTVEMNMNSIERIKEYLEVPSEPPSTISEYRSPVNWPTRGQISIQNLVLRYAVDLDPVIKNLSVDINPGEKIGIVGRTGAGKSTLALAFFRFVDPENGSIHIDGVDIHRLGLNDLRSNLTIIPQEAILFSGTIRSNLDPFDDHDDQTIWNALRRVHLIDDTTGIDNSIKSNSSITSLDQPVTENGQNFSQGQRQLLSLARALLRQPKIIIMDEATASVDYTTDTKIQETIRNEFAQSTLLCIAHRLRTVIDYDRILVLERGQVKEFDKPSVLLDTPSSVFRSMCQESGELETLLEMASKSFSS